MRTPPTLRLALFPALLLVRPTGAQQVADSSYRPTVARPAYSGGAHPRVAIDEGHLNFHTATGRYKPFAELLEADGYRVVSSEGSFSVRSLAGIDVLVIANPSAGRGIEARDRSAFTDAEADAVRDWVAGGGSLLLVADHAPFGRAVRDLAARFGVEVSGGVTTDPQHHDPESGNRGFLLFTRENGLLGSHPILAGRDASEAVSRVLTFTGTSLLGPPASAVLLRLADSALDRPPPTVASLSALVEQARAGMAPGDSVALRVPQGEPVSAAGRAQGIALEHGRGRVVMLGEAAMISAQLNTRPDGAVVQMGMNRAGIDNRQLALNVMHWLSRVLP